MQSGIAIVKLKEQGSLFSVSEKERIAKFIRRFQRMIDLYFLQPYEKSLADPHPHHSSAS